jgi:hypothetical protein
LYADGNGIHNLTAGKTFQKDTGNTGKMKSTFSVFGEKYAA